MTVLGLNKKQTNILLVAVALVVVYFVFLRPKKSAPAQVAGVPDPEKEGDESSYSFSASNYWRNM